MQGKATIGVMAKAIRTDRERSGVAGDAIRTDIKFRKSLRNGKINYRNGWFFVTCQVARNKSIFGAIVGTKVVLNELGRQAWEYWQGMPRKYPELEILESVLMPNHFHALIRIHYRATNREHHLGFLMSRFKGGTGFLYGKLRRVGLVEDIGEHLWQLDYWDDLVTSERELAAQAKYIRENPANWSRDRYGACTSYSWGNLDLLNRPRIAFVASQGFPASELRPRRISQPAASAVDAAIISTFTSAQEREALRRTLAKGRCVIQVRPQGIPPEHEMSPELAAACRAGNALVLSPQPAGSRLNKKVATWCNEYILRHADEIWAGDISPNGMLAAMLGSLPQLKR